MSEAIRSDVRTFTGYFAYVRKMFTRQTGMKIDGGLGVSVQELTPTNGSSTALDNDTGGVNLEHGSLIAGCTLTMPTTPEDGQVYTLSSRSAVTALTHSAAAGQTIRGALTTIAVNGFASYRYRASDAVWVRCA